MKSSVAALALVVVAGAASAAGPARAERNQDFADMTPAARALFEAAAAHPEGLTLERTTADPLVPPATIRVWRRGVDGSTSSCTGRVDVIPFEDYVKGVVPHEWIPSWDPKALQMGAVCARTFAWALAKSGGKYPCADVDDTAASQVYKDDRNARTDAAVDATRGVTIVRNGALVVAEYSAENGDPTAFGVAEPYCTGQTVNGHGRGTCQWGTQRWATKEGRDYVWMVAHYYPGAGVSGPPQARYAAGAATVVYPATMAPGEEAEVTVDLANDGWAAWDASTRLATSGPRERSSPFQHESWLGPTRPAAVAAPTAPGAVGRFSFKIRAPQEGGSYTEQFGLVEESVGWMAPDDARVVLTITVEPPADGCACRAAARGGRGGWFVLVALAALTLRVRSSARRRRGAHRRCDPARLRRARRPA